MNQLDYKKKYDEALERMKSWARGEHPECFTEAQKAAEFVFPELAESEDERIMKNIITFLDELFSLGKNANFDKWSKSDCAEWIVWLEKQGEQPYWKPSEEQMQTLHAQLNEGAVTYPEDKRILFTLYEDLMKIMTQEEKQGEKS